MAYTNESLPFTQNSMAQLREALQEHQLNRKGHSGGPWLNRIIEDLLRVAPESMIPMSFEEFFTHKARLLEEFLPSDPRIDLFLSPYKTSTRDAKASALLSEAIVNSYVNHARTYALGKPASIYPQETSTTTHDHKAILCKQVELAASLGGASQFIQDNTPTGTVLNLRALSSFPHVHQGKVSAYLNRVLRALELIGATTVAQGIRTTCLHDYSSPKLSSASLVFPDYSTLSLTPAGCPAQLSAMSPNHIGIGLAPPRHSFLHFDWTQETRLIPYKTKKDKHAFDFSSLGPPTVEMHPGLHVALAVVAYCLTALTSCVGAGKGYRNPSWITSKLTTHNLHNLQLVGFAKHMASAIPDSGEPS